MRQSLPGINYELAVAVRAVNAAYNRLPENARPEVPFNGLDREIDAAIASGDRDRAMAAISSWRGHWLHQLEGIARDLEARAAV